VPTLKALGLEEGTTYIPNLRKRHGSRNALQEEEIKPGIKS
jgi:hypothetical protein